MMRTVITTGTVIDEITVSAYTIPTEIPESDGTREWERTTIIVVEPKAGGVRGLGFGYADTGTAWVIKHILANVVHRRDPMAIAGAWSAMVGSIRELGRPGVASTAISIVDLALWDLKARLLDLPLVMLLGSVRESVPVYGSGGFTSYSIPELQEQLQGWVASGIPRVKMKVGREPSEDRKRVAAARDAIGSAAELFVDANGAYSRKEALKFAETFAEYGVTWFEEPVSSDDLEGLRLLRDRAPTGMEITAGEYGYDLFYFQRMLRAGAVDVLQADVRRCGGVTGFMQVGALCEAVPIPLSSHTAPSLHVDLGCALSPVRHIEYFHDHVRIEQKLFDGVLLPQAGRLRPDLSRPGLGLELKRADAARYAVVF